MKWRQAYRRLLRAARANDERCVAWCHLSPITWTVHKESHSFAAAVDRVPKVRNCIAFLYQMRHTRQRHSQTCEDLPVHAINRLCHADAPPLVVLAQHTLRQHVFPSGSSHQQRLNSHAALQMFPDSCYNECRNRRACKNTTRVDNYSTRANKGGCETACLSGLGRMCYLGLTRQPNSTGIRIRTRTSQQAARRYSPRQPPVVSRAHGGATLHVDRRERSTVRPPCFLDCYALSEFFDMKRHTMTFGTTFPRVQDCQLNLRTYIP
eukprot:7876610-Pyramimonas_sp.AAC.5